MTRFIVAAYNPKTGSHRLAGMVVEGGETRFTAPANYVPTLVKHLAPKDGEAAVVIEVPDSAPPAAEPAEPKPARPTLRLV